MKTLPCPCGRTHSRHKPPALQPGDTIGIFSPAGPVNPAALEPGMMALRAAGFRLATGRHLYAETGYLAGPDDARAEDLHHMFADAAVKAVICSRGGFGSLRLLKRIDYDLIAANPKILLGFSDITTLLAAVWHRTGLVTFHGPVIKQLTNLEQTDHNYLLDLLTGGRPPAIKLNERHKPRPGKATGILMGGNLTLWTHLVGTGYMPDLKGTLFFLEDHGEALYRVDRMLTHMALTGTLQGIAGLAAGDFTACGEAHKVYGLFGELAEELGVPMTTGLPVGHGRRNVTLPLGVRARLDTRQGTLELLESPLKSPTPETNNQ